VIPIGREKSRTSTAQLHSGLRRCVPARGSEAPWCIAKPAILARFQTGANKAVLQLWNWLMPSIFGLRPLSFWQAVGLLGLSWILFGGFRGLGRIPHGPSYRWQRMTPEEREKFRKVLEGRCRKDWKSQEAEPGA
jgi:hypothetical protein